MEFFGDHRLVRIGANARRGHIQQCRIIGLGCGRFDCIAKADVDLHRDTGSRQCSVEPDPQRVVFGGIADRFCRDARAIVGKPIRGNRERTDFLHCRDHGVCLAAAVPG